MNYRILGGAPFYVQVFSNQPGVTSGWAYAGGDGWLHNYAADEDDRCCYFDTREGAELAVACCALNEWRLKPNQPKEGER